ncbi:MAG: PAS domain S-box protein, partial [Myxococcales bacterium]|nr:PAS domain S-box protein [Myxococcales bacterium]
MGSGRRLRAALAVDPRSKDWEVATAGSVDLARAMIAGRTYAAIIVDGVLDDVNALIEEVRAQPHARDIPIVIAGRRTAMSRGDRRCWSVRIDDDNALRDTLRHVLDTPDAASPIPGPTTVRGPQIVGAEVVRSVAPTVAMADVVVAPRVLGTRREARPPSQELPVPEIVESVEVDAAAPPPAVSARADADDAHPPTVALAMVTPADAGPPTEVFDPDYRKPPTLVAPLLTPGTNRRGRPRARTDVAPTEVADLSPYRAVCEATTACLLGVDREGTVVFANTAGAALLGWSSGEELVGEALSEVFGDAAVARVLTAIPPTACGLGAREHEAARRDGTSFVAQVDAVEVPPVFGRLAWVLTLTDVTHRRQREASVLQAQKMEAVGQLTGGICHDFNNLLTVIVGNLREIAQEPTIALDLKEMAEDALSAAVDGVNLTRRLLAVAKERKLAPRAVELRQTLDDFARLVRRMVKDDVKIEVEHGAGVVAAMLDRTQLESAVLNLVINAQNA